MSRLAVLFPGQGSQFAGMGKALFEAWPECRAVFEEADTTLGEPLSRLIFEGPETDLAMTANTQPAILTVSIAAWRALEGRAVRPAMMAGHSLGEYSALVAAGTLRFADAVRLVRARGRYMQEAVPKGEGAMAAVIGLDAAEVARACGEAAGGQVVSAANLNSPDQSVIAGHAGAVERAGALCRQRGAKRVVPLPVSAPFHCALMKPAQERLAGDLESTEFRDASVPVVTNADAAALTAGPELRAALVRQVTAPVRWVETIRLMTAQGVSRVIEAGPGRVLGGLVRRIDRGVDSTAFGDPEGLTEALSMAEAS